MTRLALDLPDEAARWAASRVEAGKAASIDAYFAELAHRDREQVEEAAWLQGEIDEGLASGVDPRPAEQIFAEVRAKFFGPDA